MNTHRKVWIGIGVAVLTPSLAPPLDAAIPHAGAANFANSSLQRIGTNSLPAKGGAVGGETYLRDGGISDTRTRFSRDIILLQGHALIADEAVSDGNWSTALAHMTTSTEDIRAKLEPYMKGQGVPSFTTAVVRVTKTIEAKDKSGYADARRAFDRHTARASLAIRKFQDPYLRFQLRAAVEALKAASGAYDAAVTGQTVTDAAEYRDGRGFVRAADQAIFLLGAEMLKADEPRARKIREMLTELKTAWPSFAPPAAIVMNAEGVALLVSRIEDEAAVFWQ